MVAPREFFYLKRGIMKRFLVFLMLLAAPLLAQSPGARQMQEIYSSTGQVKVDGNLAANPFVSTSANPAQSGFIRGANNDQVCWRNAANTADICITLDSSNVFQLPSDTNITGNLTVSGTINTNQLSTSGTGANGVISGGLIYWTGSGHNYIVQQTTYQIGGT